jgi:hypothetical protein
MTDMKGFTFYADTDPGALEVFLRLHRERPGGEKLADVFEMCEMVRLLTEESIRKEHPAATEREVFLRAAARRLGPETVQKVYGWMENSTPA